jgi:hypothetical protein
MQSVNVLIIYNALLICRISFLVHSFHKKLEHHDRLDNNGSSVVKWQYIPTITAFFPPSLLYRALDSIVENINFPLNVEARAAVMAV